jgi:hypothetical protein
VIAIVIEPARVKRCGAVVTIEPRSNSSRIAIRSRL